MNTPADPQLEIIGRTIKHRLDAGCAFMREWLKQGDEINLYTTSNDYSTMEWQVERAEKAYCARVNKASEFVQIVLPYIYPQRPDCSIVPAAWADEWARKRMEVEEQYADYAARVGDLDSHIKRTASHALIFGRGVLWGGYDQKLKVAKHVFGEARDCIEDPDAKLPEERDWQGRRRVKPRWRLMQMYPDSAAVIDKLPAYAAPQDKSKPGKDRQTQANDRSSDLVEYYEFYTGVGVSNFIPSAELVQGDKIDTNAKEFFCIADGKVLHRGPWPVPLFLINEWPGASLDLIENPGCLLPKQPMEPGMGHLRWMNIMYTQFAARWEQFTKNIFANIKTNGTGVETNKAFRIFRAPDSNAEVVELSVNGPDAQDADIRKYLQHITLGDPVPGFERAWALAAGEFEKSVGLYDVNYAGETKTQIRNAAAAQLITSNSKSRMDEFRETTVKYLERISRRNLFIARFLETGEDIAPILGEEAGALWGQLGDEAAVQQEQQARQMLLQEAAQMGVPPEQAEPMLGPPQFIDMDRWIREAERSIDAGSMRRLDQDAQQQSINVALNQLAPSVIALPGGGELVAALAIEWAKLNRMPGMEAAAQSMMMQVRQQAALMQQAAMAPPVPTSEPAEKPPKSGPAGGTPQ